MSGNPIKTRIDYEAPVSSRSVRSLLNALDEAVMQNWQTRDRSGQPATYHQDRMLSDRRADDILSELGRPDPHLDGAAFSSVHAEFCPYSTETIDLEFWKWPDLDQITIWLDAAEAIKFEREGSRERARMEHEWMKELEARGRLSLDRGWVFEPPRESDMTPDEFDGWWQKYSRLDETPCVWPQNRQCFLNIVEHLKRALPVKKVELDPRLLE